MKNNKYSESNSICTCGNPAFGFNCVCEHVKRYPGEKEFSCEFCGIYTAAISNCEKCEEEK